MPDLIIQAGSKDLIIQAGSKDLIMKTPFIWQGGINFDLDNPDLDDAFLGRRLTLKYRLVANPNIPEGFEVYSESGIIVPAYLAGSVARGENLGTIVSTAFDGVTDRLQLTNTAVLDWVKAGTFVEILMRNVLADAGGQIIGQRQSSINPFWSFATDAVGDGRWVFKIEDDDGTSISNLLEGGNKPLADTWYVVGLWTDGTNQKMSVNGVSDSNIITWDGTKMGSTKNHSIGDILTGGLRKEVDVATISWYEGDPTGVENAYRNLLIAKGAL